MAAKPKTPPLRPEFHGCSRLNTPLKLFLPLILFSSCQINYYMKSAYNQISLLSQRQELYKASKDEKLSEEEKRKIMLARDVREFAHYELNLKIDANYTTYVKLNRAHVTYVVNAAPKWELRNYNWDYFWVGKMPYKGFFNLEEAKEEAKDLEKKNLDVYLRGVSAYSTLGWFNDPILSSMLSYDDWDLVDTIIHETIHANLYIKNSAEFNEQLATFLGQKGMELYYKFKEGQGSPTLSKAQIENDEQKLFRNFLHKEVKLLKEFYAQTKPVDRTEGLRTEKFQEIEKKYYSELKPQLKQKSFDGVFKKQFNNAFLTLYMTYNEDIPEFEKLWTKVNGNFAAYMKAVKTLEKSKSPHEDLKKLL